MEELGAESILPLVYARMLGSSWMPKVQNENLPWVHALNRVDAIKRNRALMKYRQNLRQNRRIDYRSLIDILLKRDLPVYMSTMMNQRPVRRVSPNPFDYLKTARELPVKRTGPAAKGPREQNNISDDIIKITTIIETVRRRRKRNAESGRKESNESVFMKSLKKTQKRRGEAVPKKTLNRRKRSLPDQQYNISALNIQGTKEIPVKKIDRTIPIKRATVTPEIPIIPYIPLLPPMSENKNFLDFSVLESILNVRKNTSTPKYTRVFRECKDNAATEIADLNIPPPKPKYIKRRKPIIPDIDFPRTPIVLPPAKATQSATVSTSGKEATRNMTYINLQDHQNNGQTPDVPKDANGYPADIPKYNPQNIPYVDVPDYTDRREESLDEDDRRVAKEKYEDYDNADADAVDPGTPSEDGEQSEKNADAHVNREAGERGRSDDDDDDDDGKEEKEEEERERPSRVRSEPQQVSRTQDDEADEEEDERPSRVRYEAPQVRRNQDDDEDEEVPSRLEKTELHNRNESNDEEDDEEDHDKDQGESQKVKTEQITKAEYDEVHFDINEYKKPFNLEEFFKEELFFEPDEKPGKGEDINKHESSKNIHVREGLKSADEKNNSNIEIPKELISPFKTIFGELPSKELNFDIYKGEEGSVVPIERHGRVERADRTDDAEKVEAEEDDDESAEYSNESDDYNQEKEDDVEEKIVSNEEFKYGDKDFFKPIANTKNGEFLHLDDNDDFFTRTFGPEIAARLREPYKREDDEDDTEKTDESKTNENTNPEKYKALSDILSKKDDVSRLNEDINEKAKKGEEMPPEYKNAWTLEYEFPKKKKEEIPEVQDKKN